MANNKMLIDASHREETRVVVVRGNRIEEFDFEAQDRRQLRGNIYLAKVTRVEPSLQAAFIDYGGNRHGFLAFSEIHPDYYQIPAADRQALLEAEAEAASVADEDNGLGIEEAASSGNEEDEGDDAPKKRRRKPRRNGRGRKSKEVREASADEDEAETNDTQADDNADQGDEAEGADEREADSSDEPVAEETAEEEKPKPKKRVRRPRKKKTGQDEAAEEVSGNSEGSGEQNSDDGSGSTTMAAMMDMDVISEDAPDEEPEETSGDDGPAAEEAAEKPKKKPRKKPAARKNAKKAEADAEPNTETEETAAAETDDEATSEEVAEEKPKKRTRRKPAASKKAKEGAAEEATSETEEKAGDSTDSDVDEKDPEVAVAEKPKKRRSRRKSKSEKDAENADARNASSDNGEDEETDENGKGFESVGQEDAMEEVSIRRPRRQYKIQEVIRRRQVMLVQVVKEERGNKGAALTTYLSLAGRYSVLMPNTARGGGISRKITNPADRKRLKEIANSLEVPTGMGVILRTAGAAQDKEEIQRDFDYLMRLWENVRDLTLESSAPFLVYEEGSLIKRSIRDLYNKDIGEVIVAGDEGYREAKEFMQMLMPGHGRNVKLYKGEQSLLSKYNVESQLDKMVTPQVTLKSGGYLIINQTEALVAIDVNSGKSTREHSIEATALQTNLEAAEEVARQLRLRDLAGLVVIDFIDMEEKRNNRSVERKLKECLKNDRARIQVGHISHFGLLEMSRQRIRASVLESTMAVCPFCQGTGHVRSEPSFALQIVRAIDDHLNKNSRNDVNVKIPPSTAIYILNNKREAVSALEDRYGVSIAFESDPTIDGQDFVIERGEPATRKPRRKEAVNPMDSTEEADEDVIPTQDDENGEIVRDEDERGGKRQRGRGRGRGRNRDRENNEQSPEPAPTDVAEDGKEEVAAEPVEATETAEKSAKRGRGRGRKPAADKADEAETSSIPKGKAPSEPDADSTQEEPKEPRRRTGRPGKKVRTPEEIAEAEAAKKAAAENDDQTKERNGAPPREVKRRNTRRVKKSETAEGSEGKDEPDSWNDGFLS